MSLIESQDPNEVTLDVKMAPGQTAAGFRIRSEAGDIKFAVDKDGNLTANAIQQLRNLNYYSSLQTAIDALPGSYGFSGTEFEDRGGDAIFVPVGTFTQTATTNFNKAHVTLSGANRRTSDIRWTQTDGTKGINIQHGLTIYPPPDEENPFWHGCLTFRDLGITGNANAGTAIYVPSSSRYLFDHLAVDDWDTNSTATHTAVFTGRYETTSSPEPATGYGHTMSSTHGRYTITG
jgi:hypothetical protein